MDAPSTSADNEPGPKPRKVRKRGPRCNAGGCSNTSYDGFSVHTMPGKMPAEGERFSSIQKSWIDFIKRKRKFEARGYKGVHLCSGHFVEDDYVYTEAQMYKHSIRTKPPNLKKDAFPTVIVAKQPFPPEWFVPAPTIQQAQAGICTSPSGGEIQAQQQQHQAPASPPAIEQDFIIGEGQEQETVMVGKRRKSVHVRKKEIHAICTEYAVKADEEKKKEIERNILERSKGEQCSVKMVHHGVGIRKGKRSCKVQVKPKTTSRGTQVNIFSKPENVALVQYSDAASQTTESKLVAELQEEEDHDDDDNDDVFGDDDESKDPTYDPLDSPDEEVQDVDQPTNIWEESKYIVFESHLLTLFQVCRNCLSRSVDIQKMRPKCYGSQLKIVATCQRCSHIYEWHSQPKVGNVMAGNLLLSAAILYGGASPTKVIRVLNHMNLKVISNQTFLDHQREYLQPAIIRVSQRQQHHLLSKIKPGEKLVIGGDGRSDSPGHSAKFGSYTFMDMKTNKVIDVQLVQSNEVKSSNAMEKEGLARGLANLYSKGLVVGTLITDRHAQVAKWIRETYPEIDHRYDVWHIAKGIQKKILVVAKLKDCELAGKWKPAIVNHVYWSAMSTPDGDGELMVAKFRSIENHIRNIHEEHSAIFPKCLHSEDYPQREWMKEGTKVYEKLMQEIMKTRFLNDMKKMSPLEQTSSVEAFHSVLLYWCPKMLAFSHSGMQCRSLFGTRQISAGEEVSKESVRNDFVNHVIGKDQKPQTIILVLMNKLKLGDLTRYSNAYDAQNQGGIIPNIKTSMESSASSLVLPQTDTSDLLEDLMSKVTGVITEISNPVDVQSLALDSKQTNLVIVRVEPSDSIEEQLKAADKYVKILMKRFNGRSTPFTLFFTASPTSQDSSHASGRRLLQATEDDAAKFTFINFTEGGCQVYFFAVNISVQFVKGSDGKKNGSVPLPTTGWVSTGSDCLTNRSLIFNLGISGLEGLNGTDWIESVSFKVEFNMTARDFWYVSNSSITAQLKGQEELTHMIDLHELETPLGWSYHCGDITFVSKQQPNKTDDMVNLIFKDFQIQPFGIEEKFSQANDCIGYFSPAIWMGIMTALLVIAVIGFGIGMMATVKVMDKFDDPKGKQLMINVPES